MKRVLLIIFFAAVVLAGGLAAWFWMNGSTINGPQRPDFALPDTTGSLRHAHEWDGKLVLLNFWATWCAPCREEIPMLISAQDDYADKGVQIVGLAVDEPEPVRKYVDQYGVNYPVLVDAMQVVKVQDALHGGSGLPASILIDRNGVVRDRVIGAMDRARLDELLKPYLKTH